jgi:hypothetical protein
MVEEALKTNLKLVMAAGIGLSGLGSAALPASAMPLSGLDPALATAADSAKTAQDIRWLCDPYGGCQWGPGGRRHGWRHRHGWGPAYALGRGWSRGYGWGPGYAYWGWGGPWGQRYYW